MNLTPYHTGVLKKICDLFAISAGKASAI